MVRWETVSSVRLPTAGNGAFVFFRCQGSVPVNASGAKIMVKDIVFFQGNEAFSSFASNSPSLFSFFVLDFHYDYCCSQLAVVWRLPASTPLVIIKNKRRITRNGPANLSGKNLSA